MSYWYIDGVGLREGDWCENAYPLDEQTYAYCRDNYALLDMSVISGQVHVKVNIAAYRRAALARLQNTNFVVVDNKRYYDDELPYISAMYITRSGDPCTITQEIMIKTVTERNRQFAMRRSCIQSAQQPDMIDRCLTCQIP